MISVAQSSAKARHGRERNIFVTCHRETVGAPPTSPYFYLLIAELLAPARGFHTVAGTSPYPISTFLGPVLRSYTAAIDCRQFPAASARCSGDIVTCTSFSASTNVAVETSGPTGGAVPNAGGAPGVAGVCGVCSAKAPSASPTITAPSNPIELCARNSRRERPIRLLHTNSIESNTARYSTHFTSCLSLHFRTLTLMPLATLTLELAIEHAQSLKDRRQVVRSLKEKLRHGFNISVAELDDAVLWNRATLGIAAISQSSSYLAGQLREVESAARRFAVGLGCDIIDSWLESDVHLESPD